MAVGGVILAGGLARRMGGRDKGLLEIGGRPIIKRVIDRIRPQVGPLALNANNDAAQIRSYGLPLIADHVSGFAGPLAGIQAGMRWLAEAHPEHQWLLSVPCDAPFPPLDLVHRLQAAIEQEGARIAIAASKERLHPVFGLWPVAQAEALREALVEAKIRRMSDWLDRHAVAVVSWSSDPYDPFTNINRPDDLARISRQFDETPDLFC